MSIAKRTNSGDVHSAPAGERAVTARAVADRYQGSQTPGCKRGISGVVVVQDWEEVVELKMRLEAPYGQNSGRGPSTGSEACFWCRSGAREAGILELSSDRATDQD